MVWEFFKLFVTSSFVNIWFWLFLAFTWSRVTYWTLGVPYHHARFAAVRKGRYMREFEQMMQINIDRHTEVFDQFGPLLVGLAAFVLAVIGSLGFGYGIEVMQAGFMMLAPLALLASFTMHYAYRLRREPLQGIQLYRSYVAHRRNKQIFGCFVMIVVAFRTAFRVVVLG